MYILGKGGGGGWVYFAGNPYYSFASCVQHSYYSAVFSTHYFKNRWRTDP